jgi:hypothetical protein
VRRQSIYREIDDERAAQDAKWGGPEHDDGHCRGEWIGFIRGHLRMLDRRTFRRQMIRVAALAVAAIEAHDRAEDRKV